MDYILNKGNVIAALLSLPHCNFYYLKPIKDPSHRQEKNPLCFCYNQLSLWQPIVQRVQVQHYHLWERADNTWYRFLADSKVPGLACSIRSVLSEWSPASCRWLCTGTFHAEMKTCSPAMAEPCLSALQWQNDGWGRFIEGFNWFIMRNLENM